MAAGGARWRATPKTLTLLGEPVDSQESPSSMDVDGEEERQARRIHCHSGQPEEASSQDTLSGQPDSQGSFSSMDLDEEGEAESGPAPDEAGETKEGDGQSRGAGGPESGGAGGGGSSPNLALGRVKVVGQGGRTPAGHLRVDLSRAGRHPELATPFTTGRARERTCFDRRGHHGGCACATEALRAAYAMWGEGRGDAASARAAATRHGVDRATPAREMRSSEGRVLETADAFLDDKADRLWRTRSAALRELAQKVRDGTDLVLQQEEAALRQGQAKGSSGAQGRLGGDGGPFTAIARPPSPACPTYEAARARPASVGWQKASPSRPTSKASAMCLRTASRRWEPSPRRRWAGRTQMCDTPQLAGTASSPHRTTSLLPPPPLLPSETLIAR